MRNPVRRVASVAILVLVAGCASTGDEGATPTSVDPPAVVENSTSSSASSGSTTSSRSQPDTSAPAEETTTTETAAPPRPRLDRVELELVEVATLTQPVALAARFGSDDIYVVEQPGRIQRLDPDDEMRTILDISDEVSGGNEQGLLGLAFDHLGQDLYINYTDRAGATVVERLRLDADDTVSARETIIVVEQLRANHNGGHLAFGPDRQLYIGLGDGGGGGDPGRHGQDPTTLLGSMLRLDVSEDGEGYLIPGENPFVDAGADGRMEVFAWGLRNPWKYSFDPVTGDLWIGDVGQDRFEEVSVVRAADGGGRGANFGWNRMEGDQPFRDGTEPDDHVPPVVVYGQTGGRCSVTGGEVYRGSEITDLAGAYVFGDFCSGELFAVDAAEPETVTVLDVRVPEVTGFGVDNDGELYVMSRSGSVFRIVAA